MRQRGSILVGLLWCVVLLALIVVGVLHTATMDLKVTKNFGDRIQAHYLALAGIEKARALLHQSVHNHTQLGRNPRGELFNAPDQFRDIAFGRGEFRVFRRGGDEEGGGIIYGVADEERRLNVNTATAEELTKLNGLSPDVASAILAWRGQGDANPNGANADYYAGLQPPYEPRNGPFQTIRELLMVRGVTSELLFGDDTHQNGFLPDEDSDNLPPGADGGWAAALTVHSLDANVTVFGKDRVNIQTADESELTGITGITSAIARAITQYRNQNRYQSIADLLDVTPPQNQNGRNNGAAATGQSSDTSTSNGGRVVDETLFGDIADDVTASSDQDQTGLINVNTATLDTLLCLPNMDREHAQAIISSAQSQGGFANLAGLLKVPGMDQQTFKQIAPLVTTRSETFRILSEGRVKSTGTRQRIEMVVRATQSDVLTLAYREDDL
ncbi:MAG TPA: helix-hairpin-helix domain-containing protein [Verrucomicrobiae bacterium]|jgi:DNA uptake protein ComE-like DNA-binding protein|nr:helix-hairpin-helix domain-containing protein [Verrucomicrobiae bacterium]